MKQYPIFEVMHFICVTAEAAAEHYGADFADAFREISRVAASHEFDEAKANGKTE